MNGFTHALPYLDNAYLAIGSCLPDWLSICDRKCRARKKHAVQYVDHEDDVVAAVAQGVVHHHDDDSWFHATPVFNKLTLDFGMELKAIHGHERTMRPGFVGHILIELLLDAYLSSRYPGKMDLFYRQASGVDRDKIQSAVNQFATRPTDRLVAEIQRFVDVQYWYDYETDEGVIYRINQVLRRVRLDPLDNEVIDWMPGARSRVYKQAPDMLPRYKMEV